MAYWVFHSPVVEPNLDLDQFYLLTCWHRMYPNMTTFRYHHFKFTCFPWNNHVTQFGYMVNLKENHVVARLQSIWMLLIFHGFKESTWCMHHNVSNHIVPKWTICFGFCATNVLNVNLASLTFMFWITHLLYVYILSLINPCTNVT